MSENSGFTGLIIAKVICCGGLVLLAGTGALAGLGGWLSDNVWLIAAAVGLGAAALFLYRRSNVPVNEADPLPAPANDVNPEQSVGTATDEPTPDGAVATPERSPPKAEHK